MLHFSLQIQHLIELIRQSKIVDAVLFAQDDIVEKGDYPECHPELERAMGLLAYEKPEKSPFADLLKPTYRLKVWTSVNEGINVLDFVHSALISIVSNKTINRGYQMLSEKWS